MQGANEQQINAAIASIQETALGDQGWNSLLKHLSPLFSSNLLSVFTQDRQSGEAKGIGTYGLDDTAIHNYGTYYSSRSPMNWDAQRYGIGEIYTDQMYRPYKSYLNSETYNDFFKPLNAQHLLQTYLDKNSQSVTTFVCRRDPKAGAYSDAESATFTRLYPHMRQALRLRKAFTNANAIKEAACSTLDQLRAGILLLDINGKILFANNSAERILNANDGLSIDREHRCCPTLAVDKKALDLLIMSARSKGDRHLIAPGGVTHINRPSGFRPYELLIAPLITPEAQRLNIGLRTTPALLAILTDPEKSLETSAEMIAQLHGLTPSESRLTADLVNGLSLSQIAVARGLTINTTRSVFKTIFTKTDTHSQTELVRLILNGPIGLMN